jgi:hypothetical protein
VTELETTLREALVALGAADPGLVRFGATHHRYELWPTTTRELPGELGTYARTIAGGGIGPYYGLLHLDRITPIAAPPGVTAWSTALPLAHLGCGYAAVMPPDGSVWIDARAVGLVAPIYESFNAYMIDWIDRVTTARWPEGFVPAGRCALANALAGYFDVYERRLGIAELAGDSLAEALAGLGPGAIQIANEGPLFGTDEPVDPCVTCARLLEHFGLASSVVRAGVAPSIDR